jgi:Xaa-Pro aminopeptidase
MKSRIARAQESLQKADLDLYLVNHLPHVRYLCGFSGSSGMLLVSRTRAEFYTDSRYAEQVRHEVKGARCIVPKSGQLIAAVAESPLVRQGHPRLGFQGRYLNVEAHNRLRQALSGTLLVPADELVEPLTTVKDPREITRIERAARIADKAFERILKIIRPGLRELDVARELEYIMLQLGSEGKAFTTICASGARSALPHGDASKKKLEAGDFVTLDYGALVAGYCSDITRTVVLGRATPRQKRLYRIVQSAEASAVARVKPGGSTQAVDRAARQIITRAGFGSKFGHGTGHGIGLEVHQGPYLSPRTDGVLKAGMVVTVEPGIYIPGYGGVRIEDDVLVTSRGHRVLTTAPRHLIEIQTR